MEMAEMGSAHVLFTSPTTLPRTMSKLFALLAILAGVASAAPDALFEDQAELMESEARFLYFNSSSTATSLTLLGALILLGVIFYLVYVGGLLAPVGGSSQYSRYGQDYSNGGYGYQNQARYAILCHCLFVQVCHVSSHHTTACYPPRKAHVASSRDPNQPNLSHQPCFFPSSASSRPS